MNSNTAVAIIVSVFFIGLFTMVSIGASSDNQLKIEQERTHQLELQLKSK